MHVLFRFLSALALSSASSVLPRAATPIAEAAPLPTLPAGSWRSPPGTDQLRIWPGHAPDGTFRPQPPESVETYEDAGAPGGKAQVVHDIADPTMTIIRPKEHNSGTTVIVFPGGGFQVVYLGMEGTELCDWLTPQGITCILSKYRAPGGDDFWDDKLKRRITPKIPCALQDAQRTIRLVRAKAGELGINPHRIGVLGSGPIDVSVAI